MDALFAVQDKDTSIRQLEHKIATLPEREVLAEAASVIDLIAAERVPVEEARAELGRREKRLEDELLSLEAKIEQEEKSLYGGAITSPKEAQALQDEIASLKRRQDELESAAIELLVETEPLDDELAGYDKRVEDAQAAITGAEQSLTVAEAEIKVEIDAVAAERAAAAAELPEDVLASYERLFPTFGASSVYQFNASTGCACGPPAVEIDRMKAAASGEVLTCEVCGRLVVR